MHGEHGIEIGDRIVFDGDERTVVAGVVDQDRDGAKLLSAGGDDAGAVGFPGEVGRGVGSALGSPKDLPGGGSELGFSARGEEDCGAFGGEVARDGAADAAARASDESDLVLKQHEPRRIAKEVENRQFLGTIPLA